MMADDKFGDDAVTDLARCIFHSRMQALSASLAAARNAWPPFSLPLPLATTFNGTVCASQLP